MKDWLDKYHVVLRTVLFAIFLLLGFFYIPNQSLTADEAHHYDYAVRFVKGQPQKIKPFADASAMPVSSVNTVPRIVTQMLHPGLKRTDGGWTDIQQGRYITLLFGLLTAMYVYVWAVQLYGKTAGLFSLFLFVFCPNIGAHAGLVTTDLYSAFFTIATLFHFWKYWRTGSTRQLIYFGFAIALAQLSKQSLTFLYPLVLILFFAGAIVKKSRSDYRLVIRNFILMVLIQLLVLNIGFQFSEMGRSFGSYDFTSNFFKSIQESAMFNHIPVPLPAPYLYGLDYTKHIDEMGPGRPESSYRVYLLGKSRSGEGFWNYYLVTLFFKTPVPLLLSCIIGLIVLFRRKQEWFSEFILLFSAGFFFIYFSFFYNSQVGIRHILMIFPILHVFCGIVPRNLASNRFKFLFFTAIPVYSILTYFYFFPNLIPYTNEFITDKKMVYRVMADGNIDYNQNTHLLQQYLEKNSAVSYAPEAPAAGTFIIKLSDLLELEKENKYDWLRDFKPRTHLAFTYLIFEITERDLVEKGLTGK